MPDIELKNIRNYVFDDLNMEISKYWTWTQRTLERRNLALS